MTNYEHILAEIRPFIVEKLDVEPDEVTMEADLRECLGARSLDMVEIAMEFEKKFNIDISDEERNGLQTVGDVVKLIKKKQEEQKQSKPSNMVLFFMTSKRVKPR